MGNAVNNLPYLWECEMQLKRPYYFTPKEDRLILELFNICSTEKLSILLRISTKNIINRYRYLTTQKRGKNALVKSPYR